MGLRVRWSALRTERAVQRYCHSLATQSAYWAQRLVHRELPVHDFEPERDMAMLQNAIDSGCRVQHAGWNGDW